MVAVVAVAVDELVDVDEAVEVVLGVVAVAAGVVDVVVFGAL